MRRTHYCYLNTFRLLAALMVMLCHSRCDLFAEWSYLDPDSKNLFTMCLWGAFSFTTEALACFFILSGFLVGGPVLERLVNELSFGNREEECTAELSLFAKKRFIRIIPPLFFAIVLAAIEKRIGRIDFSYWDALLNLFGFQHVIASDFGGVYWTIAYELWFYVAIASFIGFFSSPRIRILSVFLLLTAGIVFIKLPVVWLFMLIWGIVLYFLRNIEFPRWAISMSIIGMLLSYLLTIASVDSRAFHYPLHGIINPEMTKWTTCVFLGLIMLIMSKKEPENKVSKWLNAIGDRWAPMTYCLYLTHNTVFLTFVHLFGQFHSVNTLSLLVLALMNCFCLVFGYNFYFLVEKLFCTWLKNKLIIAK